MIPPLTCAILPTCAQSEDLVGAPDQLQRRKAEGEGERHHRAFLLYAMQDPPRSLRAVSRATKASDNSVRKWRTKYEWEDRLGDPETCRHACDLYASLYHTKSGGREVEVIKERLGAPYVPPGTDQMTETARAIDLHDQIDRESAAAAYSRKAADRARKLQQVLDAQLAVIGAQVAQIGQAIAKAQREKAPLELPPGMSLKPSDIGIVIRGLEMIEKSEARRLAMLPTGEDDGQGGGQGSQVVPVSQRVLQARESGGDELAAMEEDLTELLSIVRTAREHERSSNVIPLPRTG